MARLARQLKGTVWKTTWTNAVYRPIRTSERDVSRLGIGMKLNRQRVAIDEHTFDFNDVTTLRNAHQHESIFFTTQLIRSGAIERNTA